MEHSPTLPIHTDSKTNITTIPQTITQINQGFKKHMSTTATKYTLPTSLNQSYTCNKSQHLPLNNTALPYQPTTHHTLKHTYTSAPSTNHHLPKHSSPLLSPLPTPEATTHLPYHIPPRPIHKTLTCITYQTSSTLTPIPTTNANPHLCAT